MLGRASEDKGQVRLPRSHLSPRPAWASPDPCPFPGSVGPGERKALKAQGPVGPLPTPGLPRSARVWAPTLFTPYAW